MEIVSTIKENEIVLRTILKNERIERLPNRLIWDINTYLDSKFDLFEYFFSNSKDGEYYIELPCPLPTFKKYICFSKLHESFIKLVDYDEQDYQEEFSKHKDEKINFDEFCELYSMEGINQLNYIAVNNIHDILNVVKSKVNSKLINREKNIICYLKEIAQVHVCIEDHDNMVISSKHHSLIFEFKNIVSHYL